MSYAPGSVRMWDGAAWRFDETEWLTPTYESIKEGASTVLTATTTSCSRTPSTVHSGAAVTVTGATTGRNGGSLNFYRRIGSGAWALLATKAAPTGGGNVSITHAPTADNTQYYVAFTGSTTHRASSSAATAGVTVQTRKTTTKTVPVGWVQAYSGGGGRISGSGRDTAVHQGYYSGTHGNRKSLLRFNVGLPAGADVSKVIFDCNGGWAHWYYGSGGTIVVGSFNNQDTEPATWGGADTRPNRTRKSVDTGSWEVDITSWADVAVTYASFSGITVGPGPSSSHEFYGYSVSAPAGNFQLRITYSYWS
jgi:hypothetical protein